MNGVEIIFVVYIIERTNEEEEAILFCSMLFFLFSLCLTVFLLRFFRKFREGRLFSSNFFGEWLSSDSLWKPQNNVSIFLQLQKTIRIVKRKTVIECGFWYILVETLLKCWNSLGRRLIFDLQIQLEEDLSWYWRGLVRTLADFGDFLTYWVCKVCNLAYRLIFFRFFLAIELRNWLSSCLFFCS